MRTTGIDHTVPYTAVVMIRENGADRQQYRLPEGYHFAAFTPEDEENWIHLQTEVTHVESYAQGKRIFRQEFLQAGEDIPCEDCPGYAETVKRTVLIKDEENTLVGVATLWTGDTFGQVWQRVHWVAVHPNHQGKGLGKCLITRILALYREMECHTPIYLTTQTRTYRAVRVYGQMGFVPYTGEKPANWPFQSDRPGDSFEEENEAAWEMIRAKLLKAGFLLQIAECCS